MDGMEGEEEETRFSKKLRRLKFRYKGENTKNKGGEDVNYEGSREIREVKEIMEKLDDDEKEILEDLWLTDRRLDEEIKKKWPKEPEVPIYGDIENLKRQEVEILRKPPK